MQALASQILVWTSQIIEWARFKRTFGAGDGALGAATGAALTTGAEMSSLSTGFKKSNIPPRGEAGAWDLDDAAADRGEVSEVPLDASERAWAMVGVLN